VAQLYEEVEMIIIPGEQNTPQWDQCRLGIPTASAADRLVTASLKPSTQADQYIYECLAEWISGIPYGDFKGNWHTERGHELEPTGRAGYEFITGNVVEQVCFVYRDDDRLVGCSPDGLTVLSQHRKGHLIYGGGVEIKCPIETIFLAYLVAGGVPKKYLPQMHASMWITGLDRWDLVAHNEKWEPYIVSVERDEKWDKAIGAAYTQFIERLLEKRADPNIIAMRERRLELEENDE